MGGLTSAGRVMVISDAPAGADLSGGPQAMWPDKPLAPESAPVGRTQLAPDRPPLSPAQPARHSPGPPAAATLTSPPGATATSYRSNTQPGTHFLGQSGHYAEILHSAGVYVCHRGGCVCVCVWKMYLKKHQSPLGERRGDSKTHTRNMEDAFLSNWLQVNDCQGDKRLRDSRGV